MSKLFSLKTNFVNSGAFAAALLAKDWTNQELSDVYRAVSFLGQAGVVVELDRGQTDEGDPWVALCRGDGEVFLHFCRLDERYLIDSPVLNEPLKGRNFAELVDQFVSQAARHTAPNVVAFRASKVFLHPAALLTILIWSLYVWSGDISPLEASEAEGVIIPPDVGLLPAKTGGLANTIGDSEPHTVGRHSSQLGGTPQEKLSNRLHVGDSTTVAAQSGAMAAMQFLVAMGTVLITSTELTDEPKDAVKSLSIDQVTKQIDVDFSQSLIKPEHYGLDGKHCSDSVIVNGEAQPFIQAPHILGNAAFAPIISSVEGNVHNTQAYNGDEAAMPVANAVHSPAADLDEEPGSPSFVVDLPKHGIEAFEAVLEENFFPLITAIRSMAVYQVEGTSLSTSFDPEQVPTLTFISENMADGKVEVQLQAPQLAPVADAPEEHLFDDAARSFINKFLESTDCLDIIASANEIVLIDLTAFDDTLDRAFAYSFTLEDEGVISILGHYEIFADFNMV